MAVIFMDGFDWYLTADLTKRWTGTSATGSTIVNTLTRSPGGQSLAWSGANQTPPTVLFGTNYVQGIIGFGVYFTGSLANTVFMTVMDGASEQISLRTNGSSVVQITRQGTVLATGTTTLLQNVWYYMELKWKIDPTTGTVQLRYNGSDEIASTGSLNTRGTANTQWNGIQLGTNQRVTCNFDDVYLLDPTTGSNTTFLGPVRVEAVYPAAPGNYAQWSPNGGTNFACVGETYQDGDISFNQSSTANQIDSFAMGDLAVASGSVFAVAHSMIARQDSGAARTIAPLLRISGTDYAGTTKALATSYTILTQIYDVSPATSSAWTVSEVNGLESGYKLIS